jgi:hypothetical protein
MMVLVLEPTGLSRDRATRRGERAMDWITPTFVEIKMDAEIGSYQADDEPTFPIDVADVTGEPPAE